MAENTLAKIRTDINGTNAQEFIRKAVGARAQEFTTSVLSLVGGNESLQKCTTQSLMNTAMKAASLNLPLDPNLGFAYPIAYDNSKKEKNEKGEWVVTEKILEAQFQIGYKGFIQLAIRSGQFKTINVRDVRQGELTGEDFVSGTLTFKPIPAADRVKAEVIGYVAFFELLNGFSKMLYMSKEELLKHAEDFSSSYKIDVEGRKKYGQKWKDRSLWATSFDVMAKKTVLKLLISKYAPMSVQMQDAMLSDQSVLDDNGNRKYVDNAQPSVEDTVAEVVSEQAGKTELPEEGAAPAQQAAGAQPMGAQKEPEIFGGK